MRWRGSGLIDCGAFSGLLLVQESRWHAETDARALLAIVATHFPTVKAEMLINLVGPIPPTVENSSDAEATSSSISTTQLEDPV